MSTLHLKLKSYHGPSLIVPGFIYGGDISIRGRIFDVAVRVEKDAANPQKKLQRGAYNFSTKEEFNYRDRHLNGLIMAGGTGLPALVVF